MSNHNIFRHLIAKYISSNTNLSKMYKKLDILISFDTIIKSKINNSETGSQNNLYQVSEPVEKVKNNVDIIPFKI